MVKFSTVPDLPSKECERLLLKFVPASIRSTKVSQQLFLKYVFYQVCVGVCVCVCVGVLGVGGTYIVLLLLYPGGIS